MQEDCTIQIEIAYALPDEQTVKRVELPDTATVADALAAVSCDQPFCDLDLSVVSVGVHGELKSRSARLFDGDRVEIYRPLITDPKEARRRRAG